MTVFSGLLLSAVFCLFSNQALAQQQQVSGRVLDAVSGNPLPGNTIGFPNQAVDANPDEALLRERLFEFTFEGKRWYDLRRFGDQYVYEYTTIDPADSYKLLWPIDRNTLTNNPALNQTAGYPKF